MNFLCRLIGHRWQYHGLPEDRRVCVTCRLRQNLRNNEWSNR